MRRKLRSSERATERASVVFPTPGTSSRRTWPSTRRAPSSCSVTSRFPTTTAPTCSTRRSVALRTVRVTRELCGLQFRDGRSAPRWPTPDHARRHERDGQADECADGMQGKNDGILLAHQERREGPLDEQDECDDNQRPESDSPAVDRARGDRERDRGEDIHDPSGAIARRRPRLPPWHVALVKAVGDERERERHRDPADEPCVSGRNGAGTPQRRVRVLFRPGLVGVEPSSEKRVSTSGAAFPRRQTRSAVTRIRSSTPAVAKCVMIDSTGFGPRAKAVTGRSIKKKTESPIRD